MNSNKSREEREKIYRTGKPSPSVDALAGASVALLNGHAVFRFLAETFGALDAGEVDLTLTSNAACGLSRICEQAAGELIDAYGRL